MFALEFRFPAGRYHATPWGRNVNEADVAWPPEPWRLLRALIAAWWRKSDRVLWSRENLASLIDTLAETSPEYCLPSGAIHAHTRHYMPTGSLVKGRSKTSLVFDAFLRLQEGSTLVAAWPCVTLAPEAFSFAVDLASAIGYLGRAESWVECRGSDDWSGTPNCIPHGSNDSSHHAGDAGADWDRLRVFAPLSASEYEARRQRLLNQAERQIRDSATGRLTDRMLGNRLEGLLRSRRAGANTLPERLVDALDLDTADYQDRKWSRPPASREVVYVRSPEVAPRVVARSVARRRAGTRRRLPTVARFLLAGRPLPRIEDAVRIGELMRMAALSKFGWARDEATGRRLPQAPPEISGRGDDGKPLRRPGHVHAFWLPEDADEDGWIDHVSVYIAGGMSEDVQARLDRITRLWLAPRERDDAEGNAGAVKEWRLALEGFGTPCDFADAARVFASSNSWRSATPFLAAGHLKASGYPAEIRRLLRLRGLHDLHDSDVDVKLRCGIMVGGFERRTLHFHRFRSRGRERQFDTAGAALDLTFSEPIQGPLALGYGSHFGLGLFVAVACA